MPKRKSKREVTEAFRQELQAVLACISNSSYFIYRADDPNRAGELLVRPPARLIGSAGTIVLSSSHAFQIIEDETGSPHASTTAYAYVLSDDEGAILRFEFNREQGMWPHAHVHRSGMVGHLSIERLHIPTNRIAFEQVVRFLARDFGVPLLPNPGRAEAVLKTTHRRHIEERGWTDEPESDR